MHDDVSDVRPLFIAGSVRQSMISSDDTQSGKVIYSEETRDT